MRICFLAILGDFLKYSERSGEQGWTIWRAGWCAVIRCRSSVGAIPTRQVSFQPVAIGAAMEATKSPEPSMERAVERFREQAGRNNRERHAGLEKPNVGADPATPRGRPLSQVSGERLDPTCGPTGVWATACLYREMRRKHGRPQTVGVRPNGTPARDRPGRLGSRTGS